jgi:hypothetical protein
LAGIPKSQTEIHNFRTALAKVVRKSQKSAGIPKSRMEMHNFRTALAKVVRKSQESAGILKSRTEIHNFRPTLQKDTQLFTFPDNFSEIRPEISKVV